MYILTQQTYSYFLFLIKLYAFNTLFLCLKAKSLFIITKNQVGPAPAVLSALFPALDELFQSQTSVAQGVNRQDG